MAGVDSILSSVLQTVSQIIINEIKTIRNASADLKSLEGDLKFIQEFLRHSEGKREEVKEDVKQFQVAVLEAENLIDDFVVKMAKHKRRNWLMRVYHGGELIILLRGAAAKVKDIRNQINRIAENREKFSITSNTGATSSKISTIQSRRLNVEMEDVVGFDNQAEEVINMLDTQYSKRDVVSIIGMGGVGKTTLARKIYNGDFVKKFKCVAWVDVSQEYNLKDLLKKIANAVLPSTEIEKFNKLEKDSSPEEGKEKLVQMLKNGLADKRYFIVLDDVWENFLWDEIKAAFPDNGERSRVLITSRFKEVALHASTLSSTYPLPLLEPDASWELLSKKAFHDHVCPPDGEEFIRKNILSKCNGLPLAIVVVAGILRRRDQSMWSNVADDLNWHIAQDSSECFGILALSYEDLPPHLKPCFLFFGVYPEDFEIPVRNLIRLWVAEGFIVQDNDRNSDPEDVAEEYLLELIDQSLIQVASKRRDGRVKTCRIHDLLRDLAISKGKTEMFLSVDRKLDGTLRGTQPRRLSIHLGSRDLRYNYFSEILQLRSLLCFRDDDNSVINPNKDPWNHLYEFCRYLKVLDLCSGSKYKYNFPPKVEKLVHLRYLRINARSIEEIPSSISKIVNLQILDVQHTYIEKFRLNLWEMQQLRHLNLSWQTRVYIPNGNGSTVLPNLRTLSGFRLHSEDDAKILKMFPNLKKLSVECGADVYLRVFEYIRKLQRLQTLTIDRKFQFTDPGSLPMSLTKISLSYSQLDMSDLSKLGVLPNLQVLKLNSSFIGNTLRTNSDQGQFPRLEVLVVENFVLIRDWTMEGQGFQSLVYISLINCVKLKTIPDQLKQLSSLRQLEFSKCPTLELTKIWDNDTRLIIR